MRVGERSDEGTDQTWPAIMTRSVEMSDAGLVVGARSIFARMTKAAEGPPRLALDADRERCLAMLSVAWGRPVGADIFHHVEAASHHWQRGDKALANLRLVVAGLPQLAEPADAYRLCLAEYLLDEGMAPEALMKALGFETTSADLIKYSSDQPRVPAGSGRESGRWGSAAGSGEVPPNPKASEAFVPPIAIEGGFLGGASPEIIESLTAFASRFSVPTAVLGALLIPTPNSGGVTEGTLPDAPEVSFHKDDPEGTLRLATTAGDGSSIVVAAKNQGGLYVDIRTGQAIGRDLGGQLYLDFDAVDAAIDAERNRIGQGQPAAQEPAEDDEPKLCPMPTPDIPHGTRGEDYEDDVHLRVNPLAPIPRGFGVNLVDPGTGRIFYFDDCFRYAGDLVDGDMHAGDLVEAKGTVNFYLSGKVGDAPIDKFLDQATRELRTADARGVGLKYYFAEEAAADKARQLFGGYEQLQRIVVGYMPSRRRK